MKSFNRSGIYLAVMSAMLPGAALAADGTDVGTISVKGQSLGGCAGPGRSGRGAGGG